jgi:hypothetical protein
VPSQREICTSKRLAASDTSSQAKKTKANGSTACLGQQARQRRPTNELDLGLSGCENVFFEK